MKFRVARRIHRPLHVLTVTAMIAAGLVVLAPTAQAAALVTLDKEAPASVLAGDDITYKLTASNPGDAPLYNVSFRDVLPDGVRYIAGSTTPTQLGEPNPTPPYIDSISGEQRVIWKNVADIQPGSSITLTFKASVDFDLHAVGSTITNSATVYGSTNPRIVPRFLPNGLPLPSPSVINASATGTPTLITPIEVAKTEGSPEGELLRGVHDHTTVYTLEIRNNDEFDTTGVSLTDYLPAQLEFLGCGGVDNTRIDAGTGNPTEEYTGSGSLAGTPTPADCTFPNTVNTVSNPTVNGTVLSGVYTQLTWTIGTLAPGESRTLRYAAGVPLLANTTNWSARPGGAPTPASGLQASNLDNNTGASTRETTTEQTATNTAVLAGNYTGPLAPGTVNPITAQDTETVSIEDVRLRKSVNSASFAATQIATFSLKVDVSEYVNATNIVLTDALPNGYCPLSATENFVDGAPLDCAPISGADPVGADYASVQQLSSGVFDLTFTPLTINANGTATVQFKARMRELYTGGDLGGTPTTSGDTFTNHSALTATTTGIPGTGQPGTATVLDTSEATQVTDGLVIDKAVLPRAVPQNCAESSDNYVNEDQILAPGFDRSSVAFRKGDRVCFELRVKFPTTTSSRNVVITDVLPDGTTYEADSSTVTGLPEDAVTFNEVDAAAGNDNPTWRVGFPVAGGGTAVPPGILLELRFSAIVERASDTANVDITDNLMKMRSQSSTGAVTTYRDQLPFGIIAAPPVTLVKGVASINGTDLNAPPAAIDPPATGVDGEQVHEGDAVTFRVDVTNGGNAADFNDFSIRGLQIWDVLPAGITCSNISSVSPVSNAPSAPVGTCTNPGQAEHPTFSLRDSRSAITWIFRTGVDGDPDLIAPGDTRTLTYAMAIPSPSSVGTIYENNAYVRSFDAFTNLFDEVGTYFPSDNVDTTVDPADYSGPPATDVSSVVLPDATIVKDLITTSVVQQNNDAASQAVNGEEATYRVRFEVPAHTSVFNGVVSDPMPSALVLDSSSLTFYPDAALPTTAPVPPNVTFVAATATLQLPGAGTTYTNDTSTTQRFEITLNTRVTPTINGGTKTNTSSFSSTPLASGGTPSTISDSANLVVRVPNPTITKSNNVGSSVRAGETITYTLTATNQPGTTPSNDTVVIDCLPQGLTFDAYGTPTQGTTVAPTPGDGVACPATSTQIRWNVGAVLGGTTSPNAPDPGASLTFTAIVDPAAAGNASYTNTVTLQGSSLPNGVNNPAVERVVADNDADTIKVSAATIIKNVLPSEATIGQQVTYTVRVDVPRDTNFYDAALLDTLPAGIDPDSVNLVSFTCVNVPTPTPCPVIGAPMAATTQPDGTTTIGWFAGDVLAEPNIRILTITYTANVADNAGPSPVRGDSLVNSARLAWFLTQDANRPDPSTDTAFDQVGAIASATVLVEEPNVVLAKSVDDSTPQPGQTFTYTVGITNNNANNTNDLVSTAYNVSVIDTIPNGVVVTEPVIGGVFTPDADPSDGGGTITWSVPQLNPNETVTRTYDATLADSPLLDGTARTNTVQATSYRSLDGAGRLYATCPSCPTATAAVTPAFPKLSVTKTAVGGSPTYIGDDYPWRITVTNTGSGTALNVSATDTLPPNWRYVPGSSVITRPSGTLPEAPTDATISGATEELTWADLGTLLPGESVIIDFQAQPGEDVVTNPLVGSTHPHENNVTATAEDGAGYPGYDSDPEIPYGASNSAATRIDSADVVVTKSHATPPEPAAGATFNWTIDVHNAGDDVAVGPWEITDDLPTGVTSEGTPSGTGWSCTAPVDGSFTCQRTNATESLAANASFPLIQVPVSTDPSQEPDSPFTNTATASARTYDPDTTNNTDEDTVTLRSEADVKIVKALEGDLVAGQNATYTLDVSNAGPSTAVRDIVVTDTLPAGSTLVSADGGSDWDCPVPGPTANTLECTYITNDGFLLPGTTDQITVVVAIPTSQTGAVVNTATVDSPITPDPDTDNNTSTTTTTPETSADLAITKTSQGELVAGKPGTYRFVVDNLGPSDAQNVVVTDTLPTGLTYTGFDEVEGDWSCSASGQDVTCTLNDPLAAGDSATVDITVAVASNVLGEIENTAVVDSDTDDPDTGNNSSTDNSEFNAQADVFINKTDSPDPVTAGNELTYTLTVGNDGPSDAAGPIVVTDELPDGTSFVSVTPGASGSPWACEEASDVVTCTRTSTLSAGDDGVGDEITIVVDVDPSAGPGTISNTATVDSQTTPEPPGGADNNSATAETTVVDDAELSITKETTGDDTVVAGDPDGTEFTIVVTNDGPSTADNVIVTDTMPTGLVPVSASGSGWDCDDPAGQVITCQRDALVPGSSTIIVKAKVAASVLDDTTLTNDVNVTTVTPGDDPANNDASSDVDVIAEADLSLTKTHPTGPYQAGEPVTFDLTATNNGFSDAKATVTIEDTLPDGFTFVSGSAPWDCSASGQVVTCDLPGTAPLAAGQKAPVLKLTARIGATVDPDSYDNNATTTSETTDPDDSNNDATDTVIVTALAELSITKSHTGPVRIGDDLSFTIVATNNGPSEARDVVVTDTLPTGLTYVSATVDDPAGTCAQASGVVTCELDAPLEPTDSATITVVTTVEVAAYPSVVNVARVDSSTPDGTPGNNIARDRVDVPAQVDLSITKKHTDTFVVGQEANYVLTVKNAGPTEDPEPITVVDQLPNGLTYVSSSGDGWTCDAAGQKVTCMLADGLDVDESSVLTLRVAVGAAAAPGVVNPATVSSPTEDLDPENNDATDPTDVVPVSEVGLVKDLTDFDGNRATYTLTATNNGPNATSTPLVLTDKLPDGLTYVSASGTGWTCGSVAPIVTCTFDGVLQVGQSTSVTLVTDVKATAGQTIVNTASLNGGSPTASGSTDDAQLVLPPVMAATGSGSVGLQLLLAAVLIVVGAALHQGARRRIVSVA